MKVLHIKIKKQKHKMRVLLNSRVKICTKRSKPLKNISFTKPKGIAYMEKEGGVGKGFLRTTTEKGIAITNFTKKNPTHPLI